MTPNFEIVALSHLLPVAWDYERAIDAYQQELEKVASPAGAVLLKRIQDFAASRAAKPLSAMAQYTPTEAIPRGVVGRLRSAVEGVYGRTQQAVGAAGAAVRKDLSAAGRQLSSIPQRAEELGQQVGAVRSRIQNMGAQIGDIRNQAASLPGRAAAGIQDVQNSFRRGMAGPDAMSLQVTTPQNIVGRTPMTRVGPQPTNVSALPTSGTPVTKLPNRMVYQPASVPVAAPAAPRIGTAPPAIQAAPAAPVAAAAPAAVPAAGGATGGGLNDALDYFRTTLAPEAQGWWTQLPPEKKMAMMGAAGLGTGVAADRLLFGGGRS